MTQAVSQYLPDAEDEASPFDPVAAIAVGDFLSVPDTATAKEALTRFAEHSGGAGDYACIVDSSGTFLGLLSLRSCVRADPATPVLSLSEGRAIGAAPDWSAEEAAAVLARSQAGCLPVVEPSGRVSGVVTGQSAGRYLLAEIERDANRSIGLVGEDTADGYLERSVWADFCRRMPWILGLAVAGLAAGYVVHVYEDALDALVILALYMPMIADTGGNVGTQSASLVTRAISFGEVRARDALRILWREGRVALMMAAALFAFAFLKVLLISNVGDVPQGLNLMTIALAIALALAAQVISATLIGAVLPVGAVALRQDPAVIAGPALTTIVDLTGLILYFTLTTKILGIG